MRNFLINKRCTLINKRDLIIYTRALITYTRDIIHLTNEQCANDARHVEPPTGMVGNPYGWSLGPTGLNPALARWRSLRAQTRLMTGPFGPTAAPAGGPVVYLW